MILIFGCKSRSRRETVGRSHAWRTSAMVVRRSCTVCETKLHSTHTILTTTLNPLTCAGKSNAKSFSSGLNSFEIIGRSGLHLKIASCNVLQNMSNIVFFNPYVVHIKQVVISQSDRQQKGMSQISRYGRVLRNLIVIFKLQTF